MVKNFGVEVWEFYYIDEMYIWEEFLVVVEVVSFFVVFVFVLCFMLFCGVCIGVFVLDVKGINLLLCEMYMKGIMYIVSWVYVCGMFDNVFYEVCCGIMNVEDIIIWSVLFFDVVDVMCDFDIKIVFMCE